MFKIAEFLDSVLSNLMVVASESTLNFHCLITVKDFSQIKQASTENCLKHTLGLQLTSVCDFEGCTWSKRTFFKIEATDFVIYDSKWCNECFGNLT